MVAVATPIEGDQPMLHGGAQFMENANAPLLGGGKNAYHQLTTSTDDYDSAPPPVPVYEAHDDDNMEDAPLISAINALPLPNAVLPIPIAVPQATPAVAIAIASTPSVIEIPSAPIISAASTPIVTPMSFIGGGANQMGEREWKAEGSHDKHQQHQHGGEGEDQIIAAMQHAINYPSSSSSIVTAPAAPSVITPMDYYAVPAMMMPQATQAYQSSYLAPPSFQAAEQVDDVPIHATSSIMFEGGEGQSAAPPPFGTAPSLAASSMMIQLAAYEMISALSIPTPPVAPTSVTDIVPLVVPLSSVMRQESVVIIPSSVIASPPLTAIEVPPVATSATASIIDPFALLATSTTSPSQVDITVATPVQGEQHVEYKYQSPRIEMKHEEAIVPAVIAMAIAVPVSSSHEEVTIAPSNVNVIAAAPFEAHEGMATITDTPATVEAVAAAAVVTSAQVFSSSMFPSILPLSSEPVEHPHDVVHHIDHDVKNDLHINDHHVDATTTTNNDEYAAIVAPSFSFENPSSLLVGAVRVDSQHNEAKIEEVIAELPSIPTHQVVTVVDVAVTSSTPPSNQSITEPI
jgi:hypothetical protein